MDKQRHTNRGLRKICGCPRRSWPKCSHSWYFNFKVRGGPSFRFSVDAEVGKHIEFKSDAEALADAWRTAIRAGTFRRRGDPPQLTTSPPVCQNIETLGSFLEKYEKRAARPLSANDQGCLAQFKAFEGLKDKPLAALTEDDVEAFFADLRARGRAASTRNKFVQAVSAALKWAAHKGYIARNPIADSATIKREKHARRSRRLEPGEEGRLMAAATPHLQRLIVGALETGMRRGELFALRWADVNLARREITVRAETTKTRTPRVIPISARLAAVLEMARLDPTGEEYKPDDFVFGQFGSQQKSIKRAWETAVVKAQGHIPTWTNANSLDGASKAVFRTANLHLHDLRHEAGSRLLEAGWPLHHVQHMLGHANVSQTSTYLNATRIGLQDSMRRLDSSRPTSGEQSNTGVEAAETREQPETSNVRVN